MVEESVEEGIEDVNAQEAREEEFKQSIAAVLFAFREAVGDAQWMSVTGHADNLPFCVAIAVQDKAEVLNGLIVENFGDQ